MATRLTDREALLPALAEVFREHGYEGASLTRISRATGLGKGSLYHFFPGGKSEMAAIVLARIDGWFETHVFTPLRSASDPSRAIGAMLDSLQHYFQGGRRVCLIGVFALGDARDTFDAPVRDYFQRWVDALTSALKRGGLAQRIATDLAEDTVAAIQGAIVLTRALDDSSVFERTGKRVRTRLLQARP